MSLLIHAMIGFSKRPSVWIAAACAAFTLAATWPLVFGGRALYWGDVMLYFLPAAEFLQRELQAGRIPLWNPYVLCGQPFVGNPQASVFYPTTALLPAVSAARFLGLNAAIHVAIAWIGTYRYVRSLGASRYAAVLGACTFAGSAAFLSRLQFPNMVQAIAWMPWVVHASAGFGPQRAAALRRYLGLTVVVALCLSAGHPQVAYIAIGIGSIAFVGGLRRTGRRARFAAAWRWAGSLGLAGLLSAAWWLPVSELLRLSARSDLPLLKADRFALEWPHLVGLLWPGFLGDASSGDHWGPGNMWEPALYTGVPQLLLALYAVAAWRRNGHVRFHAGLAAATLWLGAGIWGGVYAVAYYVVPGMSAFHDPARFGIPTALGIACLAGLGLDRLGARSRRPAIVACAVGAVSGLLLLWTARLSPTVQAPELAYRPRLLSVGSGRRVYSGLRQETWDRYVSYDEYGSESGRYVHELTDTVSPNIGMRYGLREAGGYEPVPVLWSTQWEGLLRDALSRQAPALGALAAMADVGHVSLPVGLAVRHPDLRAVPGIPAVWSVAGPQPESVRLVPCVRVIGHTRRALEAIARAGFDPRNVAVVDRPVGLPPDTVADSREWAGVATWSSRSSGGTAWVEAAHGPCLMVVPVTAMPGWHVRLDGRTVSPVRANAAHLGVVIPPGRHTVRLSYEPVSVRLGLFCSMLGTFVMCMGSTYAASVARRRRRVKVN